MYSFLASRPTTKTPHIPQKPCMGAADSGSSMRRRRKSAHTASNRRVPTAPAISAAHGSSTWHPAVMETKPTRVPLHTASRSQARWRRKAEVSAVSVPAAPDSVVVTAARPTVRQ